MAYMFHLSSHNRHKMSGRHFHNLLPKHRASMCRIYHLYVHMSNSCYQHICPHTVCPKSLVHSLYNVHWIAHTFRSFAQCRLCYSNYPNFSSNTLRNIQSTCHSILRNQTDTCFHTTLPNIQHHTWYIPHCISNSSNKKCCIHVDNSNPSDHRYIVNILPSIHCICSLHKTCHRMCYCMFHRNDLVGILYTYQITASTWNTSQLGM